MGALPSSDNTLHLTTTQSNRLSGCIFEMAQALLTEEDSRWASGYWLEEIEDLMLIQRLPPFQAEGPRCSVSTRQGKQASPLKCDTQLIQELAERPDLRVWLPSPGHRASGGNYLHQSWPWGPFCYCFISIPFVFWWFCFLLLLNSFVFFLVTKYTHRVKTQDLFLFWEIVQRINTRFTNVQHCFFFFFFVMHS